jgi:hypothetical protein
VGAVTLSLLVSWCVLASPCSTTRAGDAITSPDGKVTVFVTRDASRTDDTALGNVAHEDLCISRGGGAPTVLVAGRGGPKPEKTLASFETLVFSPDGATLFFTTTGWVTSPAAHSVELATGKETFLFDGAIRAPAENGHYLAGHFRIDDEHPVTSPEYRGRMETWTLVTRAGKLVRKVSDAEAQKWLR